MDTHTFPQEIRCTVCNERAAERADGSARIPYQHAYGPTGHDFDPGPGPDSTPAGAWTPERGWHNVTESERQAMQADAIRRLTGREPRTWQERAQAGQLVRKDYTAAVQS